MILSVTQDERNKLYVAHCLLDGKMTASETAEILSLSEAVLSLSPRPARFTLMLLPSFFFIIFLKSYCKILKSKVI